MTLPGAAPGRPAGWSGGLAAGALAVFALVPLGTAWQLAPDLGHGWAVPLLVGYLLWERWRERPSALARSGLGWGWLVAAAGLGIAALPLRLLLVPYPLWPALVGAYTLLLVAVALAAAWLWAGWPGVRWLGGPLTLLAAGLPWPYQVEGRIIAPLRQGIASLAAEISVILGRPAIAAGTTVRIGSAWIGVEEACGGIRSLQAAILIALFFGEWFRFSWWRRGALVAVAAVAACSGNFLRILFLALRAGSGATLASVHDAAGWFALIFSLAATGLVAWRWARRRGPAAVAAPRTPGAGGAAVRTWLWVCVLLLAADETSARWWFSRGAAVRAFIPRWTVRLPRDEWSFQEEPLGQIGQEMLRPDFFAAGQWRDGSDRTLSAYYVEWRKGQVARFIPFFHNPTICLPMAGCNLVASLGAFTVPWAGGGIPFHRYLFHRAGQDLTVAFAVWDPARGGPLEREVRGPGWWAWFGTRWADVRDAQADQPAQLLAVAITGADGSDQLASVLRTLIVPASPEGGPGA